MNASLQAAFVAFVEACTSLHGQRIHLREAISTNTLNFDRHFTTYSELVFLLTNSYVRLSGGRLILAGYTHSYEIGGDQLAALAAHGPGHFEILERYSDTVFRRTILQVVPAAPVLTAVD